MKTETASTDSPGAIEAQGTNNILDSLASLDRDSQLQRGLKSRHIQFLALGGA
jgi:Gamma-aminobutyrate permease and related permeases